MRLKTKALWIAEGDNNTELFHRFDSHRINVKTIIDIQNDQGICVSSFRDKCEACVSYIQNLFTELEGYPIQEMLKLFVSSQNQ